MGKTYAGNTSDVSAIPKKIYAGDTSNHSVPCKVAYCGDSNGKSVEVWRNSDLPSAYQKIEYIYNTSGGNQWIDTGVIPNSDTTIYVKYKPLSYPSGNLTHGVFGIIYNTSTARVTYESDGTTYFGTGSSFSLGLITANTINEVIYNAPGGKFYLNGVPKATKTNTFSAFSNKTMPLFALWAVQDNKYYYDQNTLYIYKFSVRQNNVLIRDMYPCYLKSDSQTVGMYDLIGGQFYGNSGTGIFYKGPDID
jgi:hypothetical protein